MIQILERLIHLEKNANDFAFLVFMGRFIADWTLTCASR